MADLQFKNFAGSFLQSGIGLGDTSLQVQDGAVFPDQGDFVIVVEDLAAFTARYGDGLPVAGQWDGGLSNRQEQVTLQADGDD